MGYQKTVPERGLEWIKEIVEWGEETVPGDTKVFLFRAEIMPDIRRWLYAWWKAGGEKERWTTKLLGEEQLMVMRRFVKGDTVEKKKPGTGDKVLDFIHDRLMNVDEQDEAEKIVREGLDKGELDRREVLRVLEEWERVSFREKEEKG